MQHKNAKNLYELDKLFIINDLMTALENSGCLTTVASNDETKKIKGKTEQNLYLFDL
jgi:hypothetical protein